jgi:hypothetical protein
VSPYSGLKGKDEISMKQAASRALFSIPNYSIFKTVSLS